VQREIEKVRVNVACERTVGLDLLGRHADLGLEKGRNDEVVVNRILIARLPRQLQSPRSTRLYLIAYKLCLAANKGAQIY
jgi:hypothetical protein